MGGIAAGGRSGGASNGFGGGSATVHSEPSSSTRARGAPVTPGNAGRGAVGGSAYDGVRAEVAPAPGKVSAGRRPAPPVVPPVALLVVALPLVVPPLVVPPLAVPVVVVPVVALPGRMADGAAATGPDVGRVAGAGC
ncbi:hypothetical protein [Virgisporangium aurantiacum]|uniref:hypothetical protein n=1 Tax=Virgisporangium aurantiacum TaxID=175570 RepID=UPI00195156A4|nr:hypothetical protein [Virgisporangium aurantiacum]